ncbi:hypothetical protein QTP86_014150, partial [Hemibagrus guttatus]
HCVLSPLLYSLNTHNCIVTHSSNAIIKFADDTMVVGLVTDQRANSGLQETGKKTPPTPHPTINGTPVEWVDSIKFLRTHITEDLTGTVHIDNVVKKSHQHLFFHTCLRKFSTNANIVKSFYTCTVESILTGCITTWYGNFTALNRRALQRVVRTAHHIVRALLCWHPTKPVLAVGWETGETLLLTHPHGENTPLLNNTHTTCITLLEWSCNGARLVTGDQELCKEGSCEEELCKEGSYEEELCKEGSCEEELCKEGSCEEELCKEGSCEEELCKEGSCEEELCKEGSCEKELCKEGSCEEELCEELCSVRRNSLMKSLRRNSVSRNSVRKNSVRRNSVRKNSEEELCEEELCKEEFCEEELCDEEIIEEELCEEELCEEELCEEEL